MNTDRIMRSKIYRFLDYLLRLIVLNGLVVIPSFSFFIIYANYVEDGNNQLITYLSMIPILLLLFPSVVACFDVIRHYETKENDSIFKDFFKSFKKNYIKSFLISILIILLTILIYNSIIFFYNYASSGVIYIIGLVLSLSFAIILLMITIHICLVLTYFGNLRIKETLKLACIMAFKDIGTTILIIILSIIIMALNIVFYVVLAIGGLSIPIYLAIKLSFKQYIKIYRKVGNK